MFRRATCTDTSKGLSSRSGARAARRAIPWASCSLAPWPAIPSRAPSIWVNISTRSLRQNGTLIRRGQERQSASPPGRRRQTESQGAGGFMNRRTAWTIFTVLATANAYAQPTSPARKGGGPDRSGQTMKTLARGADFAVASITQQAALTEERVLRAGGNAFDAIVAGQAVLGVAQPSANGIGSDAVLLVYEAKSKKVFSINAEGTAPKLATIDWYK